MNSSADIIRDEVLVTEYLHGKSQAFSQLYQRYRQRIYFLVRQYFPNQRLAEEIFQEVFMKVLERIQSFDASGAFKGWVYALARNHCIDRLRYYSRRPEIPESQFGKEGEDCPSPLERIPQEENHNAENNVYNRELALAIDSALVKLPNEQKETFLLRERGGLTFEEIAKLHGVSVNTVKSRMRYALEALRRCLRGKKFVQEVLE